MLTANAESDDLSNASSVTQPVSSIRRPASQRIHRACDRCRVKKSKCNGQQPCNTCGLNQRTCVFSALRRRDIRKWHCRTQDIVDEAIQRLYRACKANGCFPGVPPASQYGPATTEDILIGMGFSSVALSPVPGTLPPVPTEACTDNNYIKKHAQHSDKRSLTSDYDETLPKPLTTSIAPPPQPVIQHISPGVYELLQPSFAVAPKSAIDQSHDAIPRWTASERPQPQRYHHHYQHDPTHQQNSIRTKHTMHPQSVPFISGQTISPSDVSPASFAYDSHDNDLISPYVAYNDGLFWGTQQTWHAYNALLNVQQ